MGLYIDFKGYNSKEIKKKPTRVVVPIKDKKFIFEISMNRTTEALMLSIYDLKEDPILSGIRLIPNIDLTMSLSKDVFVEGVSVWAQWSNLTNNNELTSFMNNLKLYIGGVE
jgi:hypothetical protein